MPLGTTLARAAVVKKSFQFSGRAPDDIETIDAKAFRELVASGKKTFIVDVRDDDEIERSGRHMPTAREIPVRRLFVERDELLRHAGETVVTVSTTGVRSRAAAFTLHLLGLPDVRSLEGGLAALSS